MDDESKVVNEEAQEQPTEESTTQEEVIESQAPSEADTDSSSDGEQQDTNSSQGEESGEPKKSRLDRRIEKLSEKKSGIDSTLERLKNVKSQVETQPAQDFKPRPLIDQQDLERGEVDPQEIERRRQEDWQFVKEQAKRETMQQLQYNNTVNEHLMSTERLKDKPEFQSEKFAREFERQYELANTVYNPITGDRQFVPQITPEQVYQSLKEVVDDQVTKATSRINQDLSQQSSERPLDPSTQSQSTSYSVEDLEKMLWDNPDKVNEIITKKYSR